MASHRTIAVLVAALGALLAAADSAPAQPADPPVQHLTTGGQVASVIDADPQSNICAIPNGERCKLPSAHPIDDPCACWTWIDNQHVRVAGRVVA